MTVTTLNKDKINESANYLRALYEWPQGPLYGIVLGTGLGNLVGDIQTREIIEYGKIPNFPVSTVESHQGKLIFGQLGEKNVIAMQGRFHYYEGYNMQQITFPIRVMKALGIERLFISNAAGGLNPEMQKGDIMILNDHINLLPANPLTGPNEDSMGPRFPDMSQPYDPAMIERGLKIAAKHKYRCSAGVYVSVPGPNLETKAEYVYLHTIGADAVGMSTVPEVLVARHMDLPVFAVSVITDMGYPPEVVEHVTLEKVIEIAAEAEPKMTHILRDLIAQL